MTTKARYTAPDTHHILQAAWALAVFAPGITDLRKRIGILSLAAFAQRELFWLSSSLKTGVYSPSDKLPGDLP